MTNVVAFPRAVEPAPQPDFMPVRRHTVALGLRKLMAAGLISSAGYSIGMLVLHKLTANDGNSKRRTFIRLTAMECEHVRLQTLDKQRIGCGVLSTDTHRPNAFLQGACELHTWAGIISAESPTKFYNPAGHVRSHFTKPARGRDPIEVNFSTVLYFKLDDTLDEEKYKVHVDHFYDRYMALPVTTLLINDAP